MKRLWQRMHSHRGVSATPHGATPKGAHLRGIMQVRLHDESHQAGLQASTVCRFALACRYEAPKHPPQHKPRSRNREMALGAARHRPLSTATTQRRPVKPHSVEDGQGAAAATVSAPARVARWPRARRRWVTAKSAWAAVSRPGRAGSEQPALGKRGRALAPHNKVVQHAHIDELQGRAQRLRQHLVGP